MRYFAALLVDGPSEVWKEASTAPRVRTAFSDSKDIARMAVRAIAMIPARMGSQRLKQKNLQPLAGKPLIRHAIDKCLAVNLFDEVWVNSEHKAFGDIATDAGARFHQRPEVLGDDATTSEQFVREFLDSHPCEWIFQVHSIAPLLSCVEIERFVGVALEGPYDALLSIVEERTECCLNGTPINFTFDTKTNSQELAPVQRVTWSISGWRSATFLHAARNGRCATYAGAVGFHPISRPAGHIIKTPEDLTIAEALFAAALKDN